MYIYHSHSSSINLPHSLCSIEALLWHTCICWAVKYCKNVSWMAIISMYCRAADSIFCHAGAAGSPVSDRPAPTDPREHHESLTGEISHQTQRPLTSAVQQWRETFQCVTNSSHWLRWLQFAQVWWPNMLGYLHAFLRCPQIPLTAAAEAPFTYMFFVWHLFDMDSCACAPFSCAHSQDESV